MYIPMYKNILNRLFSIGANILVLKWLWILGTILCYKLQYFPKSFHQVHERLLVVHDASQNVHELVFCAGTNRYKRYFWVLWTALWASSQTIMSSFVSKPVWNSHEKSSILFQIWIRNINFLLPTVYTYVCIVCHICSSTYRKWGKIRWANLSRFSQFSRAPQKFFYEYEGLS